MFMNEIYDGYMKQRLLDVALSRRKIKPFMKATIPSENITRVDEFRFLVVSDTNKDINYNVDLTIGMCQCMIGKTGKVCKHQIACGETAVMNLPQVLENTAENRHWLAGVAKGTEELPTVAFFSNEIKIASEVHADSCSNVVSPVQVKTEEVETMSVPLKENEVASKAIDSPHDNSQKIEPPLNDLKAAAIALFSDTLHRLGDNTSRTSIEAFMKKVKVLKSTNHLNSFLHSCGSLFKLSGAGRGKIPCQPTSVSRRSIGMPRGAAPLGKGRKRKADLLVKAAKRRRNLALNVLQNQPNAKSH